MVRDTHPRSTLIAFSPLLQSVQIVAAHVTVLLRYNMGRFHFLSTCFAHLWSVKMKILRLVHRRISDSEVEDSVSRMVFLALACLWVFFSPKWFNTLNTTILTIFSANGNAKSTQFVQYNVSVIIFTDKYCAIFFVALLLVWLLLGWRFVLLLVLLRGRWGVSEPTVRKLLTLRIPQRLVPDVRKVLLVRQRSPLFIINYLLQLEGYRLTSTFLQQKLVSCLVHLFASHLQGFLHLVWCVPHEFWITVFSQSLLYEYL